VLKSGPGGVAQRAGLQARGLSEWVPVDVSQGQELRCSEQQELGAQMCLQTRATGP
jgi:hypothetical protein